MIPFETLVLRAQSGILPLEQRQDAFAELVTRFQNLVFRNAYDQIDDPTLIPDIVQETFLTAWSQLESLQTPRAFPSWLKRILHTQCNRIARRIQPDLVPIDQFELANPKTDQPDTLFESRDIRNLVRDAIANLPEHERIIVELFYLKGDSQRDISKNTGLPVKTIKSRLYSARQRLLDWLKPTIDTQTDLTLLSQPRVLSTTIRPDQATNMLQNALEITRLETILPIAQQYNTLLPQPILLPVPQITGAIAPTFTY